VLIGSGFVFGFRRRLLHYSGGASGMRGGIGRRVALRRCRAGFGLLRVGLGLGVFRPGNIIRNIFAVQAAQPDSHVFID
jgi:hypothetical protein